MKDAREPDFMLISFILATRNKAHEQPAGRNTALCSRLCLSAAPPPDVTTVLATDWSWRHEAPKHRRQTSSVPPASYVNSRTTKTCRTLRLVCSGNVRVCEVSTVHRNLQTLMPGGQGDSAGAGSVKI
ncbi:hypothetical protein NDU88_004023 [Pleurodeles waltl]|uniref:Uncharacterized protein n=1 Tax=Pleurodeles waltl TaxID=8319 RepID=A0AAV7W3T6_PLEWA|nr:hypothetical protein NDU88_004023 [Pleurodeles waltl]